MLAEEMADQAIATAKEEVAAALQAAETDRKTRLTTAEAALKEEEYAEQIKHEREVADAIKKIEKNTEAQVAAITQRFITHKAELSALLKERFNR